MILRIRDGMNGDFNDFFVWFGLGGLKFRVGVPVFGYGRELSWK